MIETIEQTCECVQAQLDRWRGGNARLWEFTASHDTLTLRLFADDRPGNLHVVCAACLRLETPVFWENCKLDLNAAETRECGQLFHLKDEKADFRGRGQ